MMPKALPDKALLRRRILSERGSQSADAAQRLHDKVVALPAFKTARTLFCYSSVDGEADTQLILATAWRMGKTVYLPLCRDRAMRALRANGFDELVKHGRLMIAEPPAMGEEASPDAIDLTLVPALAFDKRGYRLGYGGGYYDRFLSGYGGLSVGLCRAEYVLETIPLETHDVAVSLVLTDE